MYQLKFNEMLGNSSALGESSITLKWPKCAFVSQSFKVPVQRTDAKTQHWP